MIGNKIAHYEVTAKLGEGGMGEVYRATDTRLNREVALKILPEQFASDSQRMGRFQREAEVLASLSHPNIGHIYGIEDAGDTKALVLELIEGPTLADRIAAGPVPLDEALQIALQICEALEAAHRQGVVHRDLKPANIKITPEGRVKVLDFGLAKALDDGPGSPPDLTHSPTLTMSATREGVLMGTAAYMSPEQARGKPVDKRADIWAFGIVLFEMLSGRAAYSGETVSDVLARVLERDPDWESLPALPPAVSRVLRRCLTKDPKQRLHDSADARLEIEDALTGESDRAAPTPAAPVSAWRLPLTWVLLAVIAVLATLLIWRPSVQIPAQGAPSRLSLNLPPEAPLAPPVALPLGISHPSLKLSPDGSHLAYVTFRDGTPRLQIRHMETGDTRTLAGTQGVYSPFFSPDGLWVGFFGDRKLKKVALDGGTPEDLAEAPQGGGASWAKTGDIYFVPDEGKPVHRLPANGGPPEALPVSVGASFNLADPHALPGGKVVLIATSKSGLLAHSVETGQSQVVFGSASGEFGGPVYVPTGHLLYSRPGRVMAARFDPQSLEVTGSSFTVLEGIQTSGRGAGQFAVSESGTFVYLPGGDTKSGRFVWSDRETGASEPLGLDAGVFGGFSLSPDGSRVAIPIIDGSNVDLWLYDTERGVPTRFTFDGKAGFSQNWAPDGRQLFYTADKDAGHNVFVKPVDGGAADVTQLTAHTVFTGAGHGWTSTTPAAMPMLLESDATRSTDVFLLFPDEEGEKRSRHTLPTPFQENFPAISPDGERIAYYSNASGRWEIYVTALEEVGSDGKTGPPILISTTGGGEEPVWSRDGRELFYRWGNKIYVVDVTLEPEFSVSPPRIALEGSIVNVAGWSYDISPDGKRFLVLENEELGRAATELVVITNFFEYLHRLDPAQ